jgi:hypothetical protein
VCTLNPQRAKRSQFTKGQSDNALNLLTPRAPSERSLAPQRQFTNVECSIISSQCSKISSPLCVLEATQLFCVLEWCLSLSVLEAFWLTVSFNPDTVPYFSRSPISTNMYLFLHQNIQNIYTDNNCFMYSRVGVYYGEYSSNKQIQMTVHPYVKTWR